MLHFYRVTVVPSKGNFVEIAPQMSAAEGMKDALLYSFKNNIERFSRVDVNLATSILYVAEMDSLMTGKMFADS